MKFKRMSLWRDNHVMVEIYDGRPDANFYEYVTPSSFRRIEKLIRHAPKSGLKVSVSMGTEGLLFIAIDRNI